MSDRNGRCPQAEAGLSSTAQGKSLAYHTHAKGWMVIEGADWARQQGVAGFPKAEQRGIFRSVLFRDLRAPSASTTTWLPPS